MSCAVTINITLWCTSLANCQTSLSTRKVIYSSYFKYSDLQTYCYFQEVRLLLRLCFMITASVFFSCSIFISQKLTSYIFMFYSLMLSLIFAVHVGYSIVIHRIFSPPLLYQGAQNFQLPQTKCYMEDSYCFHLIAYMRLPG